MQNHRHHYHFLCITVSFFIIFQIENDSIFLFFMPFRHSISYFQIIVCLRLVSCVPNVTSVCLRIVYPMLPVFVFVLCTQCYQCLSSYCVPNVTSVCLRIVYPMLPVFVFVLCTQCYQCLSSYCVPNVTSVFGLSFLISPFGFL